MLTIRFLLEVINSPDCACNAFTSLPISNICIGGDTFQKICGGHGKRELLELCKVQYSGANGWQSRERLHTTLYSAITWTDLWAKRPEAVHVGNPAPGRWKLLIGTPQPSQN